MTRQPLDRARAVAGHVERARGALLPSWFLTESTPSIERIATTAKVKATAQKRAWPDGVGAIVDTVGTAGGARFVMLRGYLGIFKNHDYSVSRIRE